MSDKDDEALAGQLYALYTEALGFKPTEITLAHETPKIREAWIQVAQFVIEREAPMQVMVFNNTQLEPFDRDEIMRQIRSKKVWDKDRFNFDEPDHR